MRRSIRSFTIFGILLTSAVAHAQVDEAMAEKAADERLRVEVTCSHDKARTPVARLHWSGARAVLAAGELEATVFKDGFERGIYAAAPPLEERAAFALFDQRKERTYRAPGLELRITKISTEREARTGREGTVVEVEGLEPGLNYFWRIRVAEGEYSAVARTLAPVCPVDEAEMEKGGDR